MSDSLLTSIIIKQLQRTRFWVFITSIISLIFTALMATLTVYNTLGGEALHIFSKANFSDILASSTFTSRDFAFLLYTILLLFMSIKLLRFSKAIKYLLSNNDIKNLEQAMATQANLWQVIGIMSIGSILIMVVPFLGILLLLVKIN